MWQMRVRESGAVGGDTPTPVWFAVECAACGSVVLSKYKHYNAESALRAG